MVIDPLQLSSTPSDVPAAGVRPFGMKVIHSFSFLLPLLFLLLLNLLALPVLAQAQTQTVAQVQTVAQAQVLVLAQEQSQPDSLYEFRFVSHDDMFYIPWKGNGTQLDNLLSLVETHKSAILNGEAPLLVDGYCASEPTKAENLKLAKTRSNRVKSELILSKGVNESCFITHNHAEPYGNLRHVVIVRLRLPKPEIVADDSGKESTQSTDNPTIIQEPSKQEQPAERAPADTEATPSALTESAESLTSSQPSHLSLRANLLRWATLTPDLGIEWRINRHWGILVNGSWTSWSWDNQNRRYAIWKVSPEVRYYLGKQGKGFLGAMYHTGEFHYKLGSTGRQGNYQGGGLTGGYQLNLNRSLSLDFHAGAGYTYADFDKYELINDVRVRKGNETKNYWGINQLGITLIWKLVK